MLKQNAVRPVVKAIPEPVLRRLPVYYQYLRKINLEQSGEYISCARIAEDLNTLAIQVRKDMAITGAAGKPKLGYPIRELIKAIEIFLGWNNTSEAYLVGAGNLGSALLGYQGFKDYGLNIVAAFDASPDKVGEEIYGKKVLPVKKLPEMIRRMGIKIGILTAPASCAQELADIMVNSGVKAIWNFAPVKISVPEGIIVQHENLASSLAVLSKRLALLLAER
ncbi:MAG: redox-sensing transcriptional repressor Rex [Candidatus Omnitrophica bacterium]|jgi:redox-sensing transcriptional repressor|nr:redox-sensing transcriptional repressor Rex [Candidatus Omnitrophota bacterium]MDD3274633.1 redox-sensing transcriptional repressor Rex [Candidatus Omnitrophota bacterium]MDD5078120.1 redox-sensing transcriptional repressor Rex [Candidatus Omnitrophota bacterium]MDD5725194.1 redox-sensing transcriptional repressor Rex [Candidatus Omnitrophota bacterium]